MTFQKLLGPLLKDSAENDVPTAAALEGKVVAFYFSASWCGPCRGFTPQLVKAYNAVRAAGKEFEVVLIGSDRKEDDFLRYHKEMPWLALPFPDRERKSSLSTKFRVRGIPALVIMDHDGSVITPDGREVVGDDPEGKDFPWRPKPLSELIGTEFVTKPGTLAGQEVVRGKTLALYFSAHWCPPCRAFTPRLVQTYKDLKKRAGSDDVEFIFVSSDKDQSQFDDYFKDMPWAAIPFGDVNRRRALATRLGVRGIPTLTTIDRDGVVINQTAKEAAIADAKGLEFPWWPKAVEDLSVNSQSNGFHVQEMPSLIVFMEACDDVDQEEVEEALLPIATAEAEAAKANGGQPALIFFTVKSEASLPTQVRNVCDLKTVPDSPQMIIVNVQGNGAYHLPQGGISAPVNATTIRDFVEAYKSGALERFQLSRGKR
ncbi:unnamed protein product [Ectocarpus sp. 4 AP-2014]